MGCRDWLSVVCVSVRLHYLIAFVACRVGIVSVVRVSSSLHHHSALVASVLPSPLLPLVSTGSNASPSWPCSQLNFHDLPLSDTSPRGVPLPGDSETWKFGQGAGYYITATREPWSKHYNMYDYVTKELPELVQKVSKPTCGAVRLHALLLSYFPSVPVSLVQTFSLFLIFLLYLFPSQPTRCFFFYLLLPIRHTVRTFQ